MPLFIKRPVSAQTVEAVQLPLGAQASPTRGRAPRPGDWFVTDHSNGESFAMSPDEFAQVYEPLSIPSTVLAAEHQAQQDAMLGQPMQYRPEVTYDDERLPGFAGRQPQRGQSRRQRYQEPMQANQSQQPMAPDYDAIAPDYQPTPTEPDLSFQGQGEFQSKPGDYEGSGDKSPISQPMTEDVPGRPAPTPEVRPRIQDSGPIETPTGIPDQPGDADKAYHDSQSPTGQPADKAPE